MPTTKQISKYWQRTRRRKFAMRTEPKKSHESWSLTSFLVHQMFPQVSEPYLQRLCESLANSSRKIEIIERKNLAEYLTQNWTTLEDLKNFPGCCYIGRELGATGIVLRK